MLILLVVGCVVFGGILFVVFSGVLSENGEGFRLGGGGSGTEGIPRMRQLPVGCLVSLIVGASIWFVLWGIVLLLALRLLRTPLGD